jgi:hypothetical protein
MIGSHSRFLRLLLFNRFITVGVGRNHLFEHRFVREHFLVVITRHAGSFVIAVRPGSLICAS